MYILNNNPKHREKFLQLDTVQDIVTKTSVPIVVMLPSILGPIYVVRKNFMGVAHNCEIMGGAKVQGGETSCPPYYWMSDIKLREGRKWIHKRNRNRHDSGNPPISKVKTLAETAAWRNNWKVAKRTEGASTQDKYRIDVGGSGVIVSVIGRKRFCAKCKHCNGNERRYCRRFSNWAIQKTTENKNVS